MAIPGDGGDQAQYMQPALNFWSVAKLSFASRPTARLALLSMKRSSQWVGTKPLRQAGLAHREIEASLVRDQPPGPLDLEKADDFTATSEFYE